MRDDNPWICDVCKKRRGADSNHWFVVSVGGANLIITPWKSATPEEIEKATNHLCGQEHLMQKVAEWAAQP